MTHWNDREYAELLGFGPDELQDDLCSWCGTPAPSNRDMHMLCEIEERLDREARENVA